MFYSISGKVVHIDDEFAVISVNGIGFKCNSTSTTLKALTIGVDTTVYTYLHVKEDLLDLFGFADQHELEAFKMLISVSGVGPKVAIAILSELTPDILSLSIASSDAKTLTRAPGVGAKLAQRIILELKDKLGGIKLSDSSFNNPGLSIGNDNQSEAISGLVALGYSQSQAAEAVSRLDKDMSVEEMIKKALRMLYRN